MTIISIVHLQLIPLLSNSFLPDHFSLLNPSNIFQWVEYIFPCCRPIKNAPRLVLLIWTVFWSEEHSSCTRQLCKWCWEIQAPLDAWRSLRICHEGFTGCSIMGKFTHFWAKDQEETLQRFALSQRVSCGFFHRRDGQMSNVCRKPFRLAESWNSSTCNSLTHELHHYFAGYYPLLIRAGEHSHVINRYRGKKSFSFFPLPSLWTKEKLTCLPLTLQKLWQFVQTFFM